MTLFAQQQLRPQLSLLQQLRRPYAGPARLLPLARDLQNQLPLIRLGDPTS